MLKRMRKNHTCNFCGKIYKYKQDVIQHIKIEHEGNPDIKCEECNKAFARKKSLEDHKTNVHLQGEQIRYNCHQCKKSFRDNRILKQHISAGHDGNTFNCDQCDKIFTMKHSLDRHRNKYHNPNYVKKFSCPTCDKRFDTGPLLKIHVDAVHDKTSYKCGICFKEFTAKGNLARHKKLVHLGKKNFTCENCNLKFGSSRCLERHKRQHSKARLKCDICDKTFVDLTDLKYHVKSIHDRSPTQLKCSLCDQTYSGMSRKIKSSLKSHMIRSHGDESVKGNFICDICDMNFFLQSALIKHRKTHINTKEDKKENRFQCLHCGKHFSTKRKLYHHSKTHVSKSNFECEICHKNLTTKSDMSKQA